MVAMVAEGVYPLRILQVELGCLRYAAHGLRNEFYLSNNLA